MEPYQIILLGSSSGLIINGTWRGKRKLVVIAFCMFTLILFDILL